MNRNRILFEVFLVILTFSFTVGGTILVQKYSNKIQYLDYVVYRTESMLSVEGSIFNDTINFSVNGKLVDDISELDIYFINESNSDFEDLPIVIEFHQPDKFEILSQSVLDQNNAKDLVEALTLGHSQFVRFGYKAKLLNRRGISPVFSLKYLIKGKSIPDFKIYTQKAGIEARQYEIKNRTGLLSIFKDNDYLLLIVIGVPFLISIFQLMYNNFRLFNRLLKVNSTDKDPGAN